MPPKRKAAFDDRTFGPQPVELKRFRVNPITVILPNKDNKKVSRKAVELMIPIRDVLYGHEQLSKQEKDEIWREISANDKQKIKLNYNLHEDETFATDVLSKVIHFVEMKAYGESAEAYRTWLEIVTRGTTEADESAKYALAVLQAADYLGAAAIYNDIIHELHFSKDCLLMFQTLLDMSAELPVHVLLSTLRYNVYRSDQFTPGVENHIETVHLVQNARYLYSGRVLTATMPKFANFTKLRIVICDQEVKIDVGEEAFSNCAQLIRCTIPQIGHIIGAYAFHACSSLRRFTIPEGVTAIGDSAFEGCTSLKTLAIPDSVTAIGDSAFEG